MNLRQLADCFGTVPGSRPVVCVGGPCNGIEVPADLAEREFISLILPAEEPLSQRTADGWEPLDLITAIETVKYRRNTTNIEKSQKRLLFYCPAEWTDDEVHNHLKEVQVVQMLHELYCVPTGRYKLPSPPGIFE